MVMRGRPATGSMMRISCGGRSMRSKLRKRGAKSVMRTWRAVFRRQHRDHDGGVAVIVRTGY